MFSLRSLRTFALAVAAAAATAGAAGAAAGADPAAALVNIIVTVVIESTCPRASIQTLVANLSPCAEEGLYTQGLITRLLRAGSSSIHMSLCGALLYQIQCKHFASRPRLGNSDKKIAH